MKPLRPRVLLIEDDTSLQRFVALALEDFEIELLAVLTVDEGLAELARAPVALVLTDLMLPGRSGFELIDALAAAPELLGQARLAVFSAGLNQQTRQRLDRPEVWRLLSKPCSLVELEDCVRSALALLDGETGETDEKAVPTAEPADPAEQADQAAQAYAIAEHFGGNEALYRRFRASCLQQFVHDLAEGEQLLATGDAVAMRRLAHSLKSVLLTLGHETASAQARTLEHASEQADWARIRPGWLSLREQLAALR